MRAASNGDLPSVRALLAAGADVNATNKSGQTALMVAAVMGHGEIAASLIEAGADPHLRDRLGLTALEWATRRGFPEVSRLLTKISPPSVRPSPTKATSPQPGAESQPPTTPDLNSKVSEVSEAPPPTTAAVSSHEQIQSEREELASQATPVEASRSAEGLAEPAKSESVSEMVSTISPTTDGEEVTSESKPLTPGPAPIEESQPPAELTEPAKSYSVSELAPTTPAPTGREEITTESKSLDPEPAPMVESRPPEGFDEPAKSYPMSELVSTPSPRTGGEEITSESKSLTPEPAPMLESRPPDETPEPAKLDPVSEKVSTTSPTTGDVEMPSESRPLMSEQASVEASWLLGESPEHSRSYPVSELVSRTPPTTGDVDVPAESRPLAPEPPPPADISTSPEKPPGPFTVVTETTAEPASEVPSESESQSSTGSAPQSAQPLPQPPINPVVADVKSPADSRNLESQKASRSSTKSPTLENEEEETLGRQRVPPTPLPQRPSRLVSPAASSPLTTEPPLERMPWMVDREPAFKASPLGLSAAKTSVESPAVSNLKRCPKCNTIYQSTMFYCTRDKTALIGIHEPHSVVAANSPTPVAVWLLIAFVLGASAFAAYRLTQYLYRADAPAPASVAATPVEPAAEANKPSVTVAGALAGMEVSVPEPEYPSELQDAGVTGPITVSVRVNKNGRVISAVSSSGDRRLRAAAVRAARQATFAADKLAAANPRSRVVSGTITYALSPPQPATATSPAPTETAESSGTNTPNADPNAPVVGDTLANAALNVPAAEYPSRARRAGIDGTITVTVRVNRSGRVISWRSSPGDSQLRAAAIQAARKASFSSEKLSGTGDTVGTITYTFTP